MTRPQQRPAHLLLLLLLLLLLHPQSPQPRLPCAQPTPAPPPCLARWSLAPRGGQRPSPRGSPRHRPLPAAAAGAPLQRPLKACPTTTTRLPRVRQAGWAAAAAASPSPPTRPLTPPWGVARAARSSRAQVPRGQTARYPSESPCSHSRSTCMASGDKFVSNSLAPKCRPFFGGST